MDILFDFPTLSPRGIFQEYFMSKRQVITVHTQLVTTEVKFHEIKVIKSPQITVVELTHKDMTLPMG